MRHRRETTAHFTEWPITTFPPWRFEDPDRAVNCRLSLRENSRRRLQTMRRENPRELISLTPMIAVNWSDFIRSWTRAHMSPPSTWRTSSRCLRGRSLAREGWWGTGAGLACGPPRLGLAWGGRRSPVRYAVGITAIYKYITCIMRAPLFMRSARLSTSAKRSSRARISRQARAASEHMSHGTIAAMQILQWSPPHTVPFQPLRPSVGSDGCAACPTMYAIIFAVRTTGNAEGRAKKSLIIY